jgi:hypothetical protein
VHQAVDNEHELSDCGPSNGNNNAQSSAANRMELSMPSGGNSKEAFDASAGDTNTHDHPAQVAVPVMVTSDKEALESDQ